MAEAAVELCLFDAACIESGEARRQRVPLRQHENIDAGPVAPGLAFAELLLQRAHHGEQPVDVERKTRTRTLGLAPVVEWALERGSTAINCSNAVNGCPSSNCGT
eukprot:m51a1_g12737 hypothetical protein (105) ;mRNA; f:171-619